MNPNAEAQRGGLRAAAGPGPSARGSLALRLFICPQSGSAAASSPNPGGAWQARCSVNNGGAELDPKAAPNCPANITGALQSSRENRGSQPPLSTPGLIVGPRDWALSPETSRLWNPSPRKSPSAAGHCAHPPFLVCGKGEARRPHRALAAASYLQNLEALARLLCPLLTELNHWELFPTTII